MLIIEFRKAEKQNLDRYSIFIKFKFDKDFKINVDKIKSFWNRNYTGKPNCEWEVPYCCYDEIKQLFKGQTVEFVNDPPKAKKVTNTDILNGIDFNGYNLYDYQLDGVKYGLNHQNWLLLDMQGLGKSLQAISLARYKKLHNNLKHCLIVCGVNSLKWNWQSEIHKFCKDEKAIVLGTRINKNNRVVSLTIPETIEQVKSCPKEFFWIINIEKMRMNKKDFKEGKTIINAFNELIEKDELGMMVLDEAHKVKNAESAQAQGILNLNNKISKMLMTGTLLVNNPYDLYCPMTLCGLINYNKWTYERKFVIKDDWGQVLGYQNMEELHDILYKSSLRRTKDMLDLPPKIYKQEWLEFSPDEDKVFQQVLGNIPFELEKIEEPNDIMAIITRIRQATVASELLTSSVTHSTKFDRLNDILEEAKINNEKVLVFCPFTEALKLGLKYCSEYKPKLVCGGMGNKVQEVVNEHENTDGFSVLFAQEATLGVGYTLTNTSICVFLSPPWNRATYDQCSDRIHRIGQKKTVQIIDLLIKDTYDENIYKKLHGKGAMSDSLIDGQESDEINNYIKDMNITFTKHTKVQEKPKTLLDGIDVI